MVVRGTREKEVSWCFAAPQQHISGLSRRRGLLERSRSRTSIITSGAPGKRRRHFALGDGGDEYARLSGPRQREDIGLQTQCRELRAKQQFYYNRRCILRGGNPANSRICLYRGVEQSVRVVGYLECPMIICHLGRQPPRPHLNSKVLVGGGLG